jgi:hypothetical protein
MKHIHIRTMLRVLFAGLLCAASWLAMAQAPDGQKTFDSPEAAA